MSLETELSYIFLKSVFLVFQESPSLKHFMRKISKLKKLKKIHSENHFFALTLKGFYVFFLYFRRKTVKTQKRKFFLFFHFQHFRMSDDQFAFFKYKFIYLILLVRAIKIFVTRIQNIFLEILQDNSSHLFYKLSQTILLELVLVFHKSVGNFLSR